ncbi:MAG: glycerophosphodiester phosphodiesterase family protein [Solirubrobacterales bacterium]|nr:glycerophosphodiester phosphodiesterase family protein [Solirubrobacterales bacterium]
MKRTHLLTALVGTAVLALTPASASATKYNWLKWNSADHKPLIMAHQGGEDEFPSNTMYAFKQSAKAGVNSLELDIGVTSDGQIVVVHNTTFDAKSNATGSVPVSQMTLAQVKALDAAYWFTTLPSSGGGHYDHDQATSRYTYRGVATGAKRAPSGYKASDFKTPTLAEVLAAFPRTPINIEIKGRTPTEANDEYLTNATILANYLKNIHRTDLVVVSFNQSAVNQFSTIAPDMPTAPAIAGDYAYLFASFAARQMPSSQTVAFQVPNSFYVSSANLFATGIANCSWIGRAHGDGYAWHQWFGSSYLTHPADIDGIGTGVRTGGGDGGWKYLLDSRVDGIMTARPKALLAYMKTYKWNKASNACKFVGGGGY